MGLALASFGLSWTAAGAAEGASAAREMLRAAASATPIRDMFSQCATVGKMVAHQTYRRAGRRASARDQVWRSGGVEHVRQLTGERRPREAVVGVDERERAAAAP